MRRYSGGVNWRQKIDTQRGAVLATELKNNSCRLARWTAQSLLAGADLMKLGWYDNYVVNYVCVCICIYVFMYICMYLYMYFV